MSSPAPDAMPAPAAVAPASPPGRPTPWEPAAPVLGVLADDPRVRRRVCEALGGLFRLDPVGAIGSVDPGAPVAGWLVCLRGEAEDVEDPRLEALIEAADVPVWVTDEAVPELGAPAWGRWIGRLARKFRGAVADPDRTGNRPGNPAEPVPPVWVLGASLGGPEAVKGFLDLLPRHLPQAFLYVQHGDCGTLAVLARVLGRHSAIGLRPGAPGLMVRAGEVILVPADPPLRLDRHGVLVPRGAPWGGVYRPDIARVLRDTLASGHLAGVVLFSGMGDDGAGALPAVAERGIPVWAQSPESCASPAMVEAAGATGAVGLFGEPEALAREFRALASPDFGGAAVP